MEFQFARYTEVTDVALSANSEYGNSGYTRVFICPDVHDTWLVRILENTNSDYEAEEGMHIMERNNVANAYKGQSMTDGRMLLILKNDTFDNWDVIEGEDVEELVDLLDDGYGIINRK